MTNTMQDMRAESDELFMKQVLEVAKDATCDRAHVGAIIARGSYILSTGVNTSARGLPTCKEEGHLMIDGHCCRTIHAEANAIYDALERFTLERCTLYVTHEPCVHCRKLIIQSGIKRVVFLNLYRSLDVGRQICGDVEWIHYNSGL